MPCIGSASALPRASDVDGLFDDWVRWVGVAQRLLSPSLRARIAPEDLVSIAITRALDRDEVGAMSFKQRVLIALRRTAADQARKQSARDRCERVFAASRGSASRGSASRLEVGDLISSLARDQIDRVILKLVARGERLVEIAAQLRLKPPTVRQRLSRIRSRLK